MVGRLLGSLCMIGWVSLWRNEIEAENDGVRRKTPTNKRGQEPNGGEPSLTP